MKRCPLILLLLLTTLGLGCDKDKGTPEVEAIALQLAAVEARLAALEAQPSAGQVSAEVAALRTAVTDARSATDLAQATTVLLDNRVTDIEGQGDGYELPELVDANGVVLGMIWSRENGGFQSIIETDIGPAILEIGYQLRIDSPYRSFVHFTEPDCEGIPFVDFEFPGRFTQPGLPPLVRIAPGLFGVDTELIPGAVARVSRLGVDIVTGEITCSPAFAGTTTAAYRVEPVLDLGAPIAEPLALRPR